MSDQNSSPFSNAPQNTQFFSENIGIKLGNLEAEVRHTKSACDKLESRIKPLEDWRSEIAGGWKTAKWLGAIVWLGSAFISWLMKLLGVL